MNTINKKYYKFILITLLCIAVLSGCKKQEATSTQIEESASTNTYTFTDDTGVEIKVPLNPKRTAVLLSSYADVWTTAGGNIEITVEETVDRGFVDKDEVTVVGDGVGKEINAEALIASKPDFVILTAEYPEHQKLAQLLRKSNIPAALFRIDGFKDYLNMLKICTDITGYKEAYTNYGLNIKENINSIIEKVSKVSDKPTVLFIRAYSTGAKAKTADNFVGQMLEELNTDNIAKHASILLEELNIESIVAEDPDFIFVSTMGNGAEAISYMQKQINANPAWQTLSAIKNNNYIILPKELFQYKPNANWATAYEYLAEIIYPEVFKDE